MILTPTMASSAPGVHQGPEKERRMYKDILNILDPSYAGKPEDFKVSFTVGLLRDDEGEDIENIGKDYVKPLSQLLNFVRNNSQGFIKIHKKQGSGSISNGGLYDDQIDQIMSKFKDFKGCIMRDEIKKLLPDIDPQSRLAFIINNQTHDKPGQHWCAIYIDARDVPESSNSLEWYDSFGRPIPPDILEDCKLILKILKPKTILKVKENHVIHQKDESSNCGWFCCRFLIDRFRGKSFSEATGFDDKMKINHSNQDEKEIERLKKVPPFNYIY